MRQPTMREKLKYNRCGTKLIYFDQKVGWLGELPFFEFDCKIHGKVINYEQGYMAILECPKCQDVRLGK